MEQQTDLEVVKGILHHDIVPTVSQHQTRDTTIEQEWQKHEEVSCPWKETATLMHEMLTGEVCSLPTLWETVPFLDAELLAVQNAEDNHSCVQEAGSGNSAPFRCRYSLNLHPCRFLLRALPKKIIHIRKDFTDWEKSAELLQVITW